MKIKMVSKPQIITAELYAPGMEDGWMSRAKEFHKTLDTIPSRIGTPVIEDESIIMPIKEGDYIVTNPDGSRYPTTLEILKTHYTEIN